MQKSQLSSLATAALLALALSGSPSFAEAGNCASPLTLGEAEQAKSPIVLAQMRLRTSSGDTQTLTRVPRGRTYQIQMGNRGSFQKFAAGATLPGTDCVQVDCPSTFGDDITCWKCVEAAAE